MGEKFISAKQVSERLHISRPTLTRIKSDIGFYRIGGKIKFTEENLSLYLERVKESPIEDNGKNSVIRKETK
jgi:excisionase family DNA binding protein